MMKEPPKLAETVHVSDGTHCVAAIVTDMAQDGRTVLNAFIQGGLAGVACRYSPAPQLMIKPDQQGIENTYHAIGECPWHR